MSMQIPTSDGYEHATGVITPEAIHKIHAADKTKSKAKKKAEKDDAEKSADDTTR